MSARCSVFIATSLDGFIARADGRIDWLSIADRPGEDYGFKAFFDDVDALVLGRNTYDAALAFEPWPYPGKRCVVMTHGAPAPRHGEELFAGEPAALVERLSREGARRIYVDGGLVIQQFLRAGLIDDLVVSVLPVLLGEGARLFGALAADVRLTLVRSASFPSGVVQSEYRVER